MSMILRLVDRIETFAMAFFFSAALLVGAGQVVARYVFNTGVMWSDQAFVKFTIWAALFGASRAVRDGLHVRVDVVLDQLPPAARRPVEMLGLLVNIAFCGAMLWAAIGYTDFLMMVGTTNIDSGLPEWIAFLITPTFLALMCLRYAALIPVSARSRSGDPWKPDVAPGERAPPAPSVH
ncbi:TRAP transporter small permease [Falsiroseomonas sp. CW058]|uniref:TRAP transporter small permease n=1 Tax=Falsiroseomonas sp. CW058 TaxID=3388664 RepID=UPI003D3188E8